MRITIRLDNPQDAVNAAATMQSFLDKVVGIKAGEVVLNDEAPAPRKSRAPKSAEAKAKDIGQTEALPEPASAKPEPAKPLDTQAIVKAWAAKFGTPKLVEKLTAAGVRRVPEIKPEHLPTFLADLQKDLA